MVHIANSQFNTNQVLRFNAEIVALFAWLTKLPELAFNAVWAACKEFESCLPRANDESKNFKRTTIAR